MSWFSPARYVSSVERIDLDALWASGKRAILLDRDNTLVPRDRKDAPASVAAWLDHARELGFELIMVSNNWHKSHVSRAEHAARLLEHRRPLYRQAADLTVDIRGTSFTDVSYTVAELLLERGLI